jgi:hypothetical protein
MRQAAIRGIEKRSIFKDQSHFVSFLRLQVIKPSKIESPAPDESRADVVKADQRRESKR